MVAEQANLRKKLLRKKKKEKKKLRKQKQREEKQNKTPLVPKVEKDEDEEKKTEAAVQVEYISSPLDLEGTAAEQFEGVMKTFFNTEQEEEEESHPNGSAETKKKEDDDSEEREDEDEDEDEEGGISKKEKKRQKRLEVALLKQLVDRPDLVEIHDVNAADPLLLVSLKSFRNTVPVPKHWCQKRKYLQGKRGMEKPPFQLPEFIAATGIARIRQAVQEKEDQKKQKQKQRERLNPKMHTMEIDYQVLHDAFFKFQTKPPLSKHGEMYYEGKEFEVKLKEKTPGQLSAELRRALGMGEGVEGPPPWLINMQRYGPPPAYPNLKIPGLNAPIPVGASFGYHLGGWGKPPVDELGRPLYGDVFGLAPASPNSENTAPAELKRWGELEEEDESEEESEEEDDEEGEEDGDADGDEASLDQDDLTSGISSIPAGIETPETIHLRKEIRGKDKQKQLYEVLETTQGPKGGGLIPSGTAYVLPSKSSGPERVDLLKSQKGNKVDITLDPEDLADDLTADMLSKKYNQELEAQKAAKASAREGVSDVIAEQERKKRKAAFKGSDQKAKKYKEFNF